jgi:hypothetical protein
MPARSCEPRRSAGAPISPPIFKVNMSPTAATARRELLWIVIALVVGVLLLPPLIWLVGSRVFGPYAGGGSRDLVAHFFVGLGQGRPALWLVALGPYLVISALRVTRAAMRAVRAEPESP